MLNRLFMTALVAGLAAGVFGWALQMALTTPIIIKAEIFENAPDMAAGHDHGTDAGHDHGDGHDEAGGHQHDADAWMPEDGIERHAFTLLTSVLFGVGFGAILAAGFALTGRDHIGWREGMVWGLLGYAALYVAPSLGLPPELPGMVAADLGDRQVWWLLAALTTAAGLYGLIKGNAVMRVLGVVAIVLPHAVGAPHPDEFFGGPPAELAAKFAVASLVTVGLFWVALGAAAGWAFDRYARN